MSPKFTVCLRTRGGGAPRGGAAADAGSPAGGAMGRLIAR